MRHLKCRVAHGLGSGDLSPGLAIFVGKKSDFSVRSKEMLKQREKRKPKCYAAFLGRSSRMRPGSSVGGRVIMGSTALTSTITAIMFRACA